MRKTYSRAVIPTTVKLPPTLRQRLLDVANRHGLTQSALIREGVAAIVVHYERKSA